MHDARRDGVRRRGHLRGAHRPPGAHGPVRRRAARSTTSSSRARRDAIVVAPATADFHGARRHGPGRRSADRRACSPPSAPVLLVPAMNDRMWAHAQTRRNVAHLRELGYRAARSGRGHARGRRGQRPGPDAGAGDDLRACRPAARDAGSALARQARARHRRPDARGDRSGALHLESQLRQDGRRASPPRRGGAARTSTLVAGPAARAGARRRDRRCTWNRRRRCATRSRALLPHADVLVMAAAPADFRPAHAADVEDQEDRRRRAAIELAPTPDILADHARRAARRTRSSSASRSRPTTPLANAREKLDGEGARHHRASTMRPSPARDSASTRIASPSCAADGRRGGAAAACRRRDVADAILDRVEGLLAWTLEKQLRRYLEQRRELGETRARARLARASTRRCASSRGKRRVGARARRAQRRRSTPRRR